MLDNNYPLIKEESHILNAWATLKDKGGHCNLSEMQNNTHTLAADIRTATIREMNGQLKKIGIPTSSSSRS